MTAYTNLAHIPWGQYGLIMADPPWSYQNWSSAGEPFLLATRGKPKTAKNIRTLIEAAVREHSRKPDECFEIAERLVPGVQRIEIFSRQERPGWDVFGNEIDKFEVAA